MSKKEKKSILMFWGYFRDLSVLWAMVSFGHGVATPIHTYKDVGKGCAVIRKYVPVPNSNNPFASKATLKKMIWP